jgi:phosphoglycerate kinase
MSLKPVAKRLEELLGRPVKMAPDCVGPEVEAMKPAPGEVLLLGKPALPSEEEKNDPEFAAKLAALCDGLYVNDAFGTAHRATPPRKASFKFVPKAAAGLLMNKELEWLGKATHESGSALHRHPGRREGLRQDRSHPKPAQVRGPAIDWRRNGVHLP